MRDFEDEYQAGIHAWDKKGDPHFSNKGYTNWVRRMGFDEEAWPFNSERRAFVALGMFSPVFGCTWTSAPRTGAFRCGCGRQGQ